MKNPIGQYRIPGHEQDVAPLNDSERPRLRITRKGRIVLANLAIGLAAAFPVIEGAKAIYDTYDRELVCEGTDDVFVESGDGFRDVAQSVNRPNGASLEEISAFIVDMNPDEAINGLQARQMVEAPETCVIE